MLKLQNVKLQNLNMYIDKILVNLDCSSVQSHFLIELGMKLVWNLLVQHFKSESLLGFLRK